MRNQMQENMKKKISSLSLQEQEMFCATNFDDVPDAAAVQQEIAAELAHKYETGVLGQLAQDKWRAKYYAEKAQGQTVATLAVAKGGTKKFYRIYQGYDRVRLFVLRFYHVIYASDNAFLAFLKDPLGIVTIASHAFRLSVDLGLCLKPLFTAVTVEEKALTRKAFWLNRFTRVRDQFNKGSRRKRMINDALWLTINVLAYVFAVPSFGLTILIVKCLQVAAYAFDVGNEHSKYTGGRKAHEAEMAVSKLAGSHATNFHEQGLELTKFASKNREAFFATDTTVEEKSTLNTEYNALREKYIHTVTLAKLNVTAKHERHERNKNIAAAICICVGMALFIFPPTSIVGLGMLIGAGVTLLGGSLLSGFGKELGLDKIPGKIKRLFVRETPAELAADAVPELSAACQPADTVMDDSLNASTKSLLSSLHTDDVVAPDLADETDVESIESEEEPSVIHSSNVSRDPSPILEEANLKQAEEVATTQPLLMTVSV